MSISGNISALHCDSRSNDTSVNAMIKSLLNETLRGEINGDKNKWQIKA